MGKISSQPASHIADPAVIRSVKGPKPAEVRKETMPHATIHSSEDEQVSIRDVNELMEMLFVLRKATLLS